MRNDREGAGMKFGLTVKAVLVDEDGRTLLIRRSASNRCFAGTWEWPGGKVDEGEDFDTALRREMREETGLEIEPVHLAGSAEFDMPHVRVIVLCMDARVVGGTLTMSEEHDASAWVPLKEIHSYDLAPNMTDFMLEYVEQRTGGAADDSPVDG
jgi:8-oxo-dGTP diphosphatase